MGATLTILAPTWRTVEIRYYVKLSPAIQFRSSKLQALVESVLKRILPTGNPDFNEKFDDVRRWWLETDDHWEVHREIGFDEHDRPIVAAPLGKNLGMFPTITDDGVAFPVDGEITQADFDRVWGEFTDNWKRGPEKHH